MFTTKSGLALAIVSALMLTACEQTADSPPASTAASESTAPSTMPAPAAATACDRQCLIDATDTYVAALVAHDPSAAPLAYNIVFVENVTRKRPGEGLWQSAVSAPTTFAIHVPDEINQAAGYLAMMTWMAAPPAPQGSSPEERAQWEATAEKTELPVMVAFRLKFDGNGKITEAEHLLTPVREQQMVNLQSPRPEIFTEIDEDKRLSHDRLITLGLTYYDALDENDSDLTAFADDCERHENGMITASYKPREGAPGIPGTASTPAVARDCYGQIESGTFQYIDRIENRRVFAADPQTGLVMGLSHFRHPMDNLPYTVTNTDGTQGERNSTNMPFAPFDLPAAHIFKIGADGKMHEIEAMGFTTVLNAPTGWE
ncbi:MAG: hypothetical protein H6978_07110 [Gammaproteobacteria bacterium]|nr:hypothetical protein [Gammaproteobacteria bacterium]